MSRKITEEQRQKAITALAEGKTTRQAAKIANISTATVSDAFSAEANALKKEVRAAFEAETGDRIKKLSKSLLNIAEMGVQAITQEALNKQSGAANSVTIGTVIDKMQLLTGGATENVQITAGPRSDDFLKKLKNKSKVIEIKAEVIKNDE